MSFDIQIKVPTQDEIWENVLDSDKNPNQFSNWFPKLNDVTLFKKPQSISIKLEKDLYFSIQDEIENISPEMIDKFNQYLDQVRIDAGLSYPLFMKSGLFSNKFEFENCIVTSKNEFHAKFYNINYGAMMLGVPYTREVVLREFIDTKMPVKIYDNMPLNLEIRAFIDFDKKSVMGVVDYWHPEIANRLPQSQTASFKAHKNEYAKRIHNIMEEMECTLQTMVKQDCFKEFNGQWSVDFLFDVDQEGRLSDAWLIDMAIAHQSWGMHLLKTTEQKVLGIWGEQRDFDLSNKADFDVFTHALREIRKDMECHRDTPFSTSIMIKIQYANKLSKSDMETLGKLNANSRRWNISIHKYDEKQLTKDDFPFFQGEPLPIRTQSGLQGFILEDLTVLAKEYQLDMNTDFPLIGIVLQGNDCAKTVRWTKEGKNHDSLWNGSMDIDWEKKC